MKKTKAAIKGRLKELGLTDKDIQDGLASVEEEKSVSSLLRRLAMVN